MQHRVFWMILCGALCLTWSSTVHAQNWYGGYQHTGWNQPVAMVTPPTVKWQSHFNWGVANTRRTPIAAQYGRMAPGYGGVRLRPTPRWPSSTDHFGVYPVRGPWD